MSANPLRLRRHPLRAGAGFLTALAVMLILLIFLTGGAMIATSSAVSNNATKVQLRANQTNKTALNQALASASGAGPSASGSGVAGTEDSQWSYSTTKLGSTGSVTGCVQPVALPYDTSGRTSTFQVNTQGRTYDHYASARKGSTSSQYKTTTSCAVLSSYLTRNGANSGNGLTYTMGPEQAANFTVATGDGGMNLTGSASNSATFAATYTGSGAAVNIGGISGLGTSAASSYVFGKNNICGASNCGANYQNPQLSMNLDSPYSNTWLTSFMGSAADYGFNVKATDFLGLVSGAPNNDVTWRSSLLNNGIYGITPASRQVYVVNNLNWNADISGYMGQDPVIFVRGTLSMSANVTNNTTFVMLTNSPVNLPSQFSGLMYAPTSTCSFATTLQGSAVCKGATGYGNFVGSRYNARHMLEVVAAISNGTSNVLNYTPTWAFNENSQ